MLENDLIDVLVTYIDDKFAKLEALLALQSKKLLNLEELSTYIGFAKGSIYNLVSRNEIPYYKRGSKIYFDREEIDTWIRSFKVLSADELTVKARDYDLKNR